MPYKDPEKRKENHQKNREDRNAKKRAQHQENKEEINKKRKEKYEENPELYKYHAKTQYSNITTCAIAMIVSQKIDRKIWHSFCQIKRRNAKQYPFSLDFTDETMFDKMKDGCVYCGSLATTIDRLDSNFDHTPDNCVGCCRPCNIAKGNSDPDTFIRKAYYRVRNKYFDDVDDIWSDNIKKPRWCSAKKRSQEQKREFLLTKEEWNILVSRDCSYCGRIRPEGKWNGVDKIVPGNGYILENTVSCCDDCNNDKGVCSVYDTKNRNEKIANRLDNGDISIIGWETKLRTTCRSRHPFATQV